MFCLRFYIYIYWSLWKSYLLIINLIKNQISLKDNCILLLGCYVTISGILCRRRNGKSLVNIIYYYHKIHKQRLYRFISIYTYNKLISYCGIVNHITALLTFQNKIIKFRGAYGSLLYVGRYTKPIS